MRTIWMVVVVLLLAVSAASAQPDAKALEQEARYIETLLVAPCCWAEQVSKHHSEAAEQVKREIRAMLASGRTRQQVLDAFVGRYRLRILVEPPDRGFGRVLHHAPWIVGLLSGAGVLLFIWRIARHRDVQPGLTSPTVESPSLATPQASDIDQSYEDRLDEELSDLN